MPLPLVSVVIPYRNMAPTIGACIESCMRQTWPHLELVLVDNNSTDAGPRIAGEISRDAPHPVRFSECRVPGVCAARNHGFTRARGEYIQWLDADDLLDPPKIERQVRLLERAPDADIAYGDWRWRFALGAGDPDVQVRRLRQNVTAAAYGQRRWTVERGHEPAAIWHFRLRQYDDYLLRLLEDKWLPPHAYLLRRSAAALLQEHRGFSPEITYADDRCYFTLAALLGLRFRYAEGAEVVYNTWSTTQTTRRTSVEERLSNLERMFGRFRATAARQPAARLTGAHRFLLSQPRNLWRPAPEGLAVSHHATAGFLLRANRGGDVHRVTREAALTARALASFPGGLTLEDHAKIVAHRAAELWEAHTEVMRQLRSLARLRLLVPMDPAADPGPDRASNAVEIKRNQSG